MAYSTSVVIIAVTVIFGLAAAQTPFKDCGSKETKIKSLKVGDCTASPCSLKKGTNVSVTMVLEAEATVNSLKVSVVAKKGFITLHIPVPDPDACHFMKCPMVKGAMDTFTGNMTIGTQYPSVTATIDWNLLDGSTVATCVSFEGSLD